MQNGPVNTTGPLALPAFQDYLGVFLGVFFFFCVFLGAAGFLAIWFHLHCTRMQPGLCSGWLYTVVFYHSIDQLWVRGG